ncbi:MAG TPA: hypothetical protein VFK50_01420 [Sphingomicrobium sp.]|nr:hypothetical protein [Sphingomicrobium sp.]
MDKSIVLQFVAAGFSSWYDIKIVIERAGMVSTDALHIIAGVLLQLLFAIIFRRPLSAWLPWLAVLAVLLFNEAVDLWVERWPSLMMQIGEGVKDLLVTMFLPTVLLAAFRSSQASRLARRP